MRSSMTSFCTVASLLAIGGVLAFGPVFAQDPAGTEIKSDGKTPEARAEGAEIPECLEKLSLSEQQKTEIKGIIHHADESLAKVWTQFGERYMQMIGMESSMLAAIEDNLTEPQREQVRAHRRKTAHQEKGAAAKNDKPKRSTTKPANVVEDELSGVGVTLTPEQEASADKIQEKYHPQLHLLHRDIQSLHARLLSLEADKLVLIEKALTKEQVTELRQHRLNAPAASKLAAEDVEKTQTE